MFIFLCRFVPGGLTLRSAGLKKREESSGRKASCLTPVPDNAESEEFASVCQGGIASQIVRRLESISDSSSCIGSSQNSFLIGKSQMTPLAWAARLA
jgi:hypothetical protein